jgi:cation diffusion facilitator family transporter
MDPRVKAASVSLISNIGILAVKLTVGIYTGSLSVISTAVDSINDLSASAIALLSVRAAAAPADQEHPYGHGKFENISGGLQALLIFAAAIYIINEAVNKILEPSPIETPGAGAAVMGFTAIAALFLSRYLLRAAQQTDSPALRADAYHLTTDVWTSLGAMAALLVVQVTDFRLIDPIVALAIAAAIIHVAYQLTKEAMEVLVDVRLPSEEITFIAETIMRTPRVIGYHKLRTRKSGAARQIDYHLVVPPNVTVQDAHKIAQEIEDRIFYRFPGAQVVTHIEPDTQQ